MTEVYLEIGKKKVFACSLDWPGWDRSGRDEHAALEALADYADRYAVVAKRAGVRFSPGDLVVVERVNGDAGTDFGVPGKITKSDLRPIDKPEGHRQSKLMKAAWELFAEEAARAPAELRKGPRGGGRDRDKMVAHVIEAEKSYARMIGIKSPEPRDQILAVLDKASDGSRLKEPNGWPARYAFRRVIWHVLDHLWEMQDRST